VVFFSLSAWPRAAGESSDGGYTIAIPMIAGFEQTKMADILLELGPVIGKKLGTPVKSEILVFHHNDILFDLVRDAFAKGEADISYINGLEQGEYVLDGGGDMIFLGVLGMQKSPVEKTCLFTRRGEFTDVSELRGKKWKGAQLLQARYLLYRSGFDERIDDFFGSVGFETDSPVAPIMEQLENGEIDVFSSYMHTVWL